EIKGQPVAPPKTDARNRRARQQPDQQQCRSQNADRSPPTTNQDHGWNTKQAYEKRIEEGLNHGSVATLACLRERAAWTQPSRRFHRTPDAPPHAGSLVTCRRQLREKISDVNKVVVEDLPGFIQQADDCGISHRIVDVLGFFPAKHDVALAQDCKLLRQRALLDVEPAAQVV